MANKFWDTVKNFLTGKKQEDSTGTTTSAAPASTEPTQPTQQTPAYKDNTIVYKDSATSSGLYQYKAPQKFKTQDEVNQQWAYAQQLGYNKEQAIELMQNGTRWKQIALGENGRPMVSYNGGKYTSQDEVNQQYEIFKRMGYSRDDTIKAMQSGTRWKEQSLEEMKAEMAKPTNAAKNEGGLYGNVTGKAAERSSSLYNSKYYDILEKDDYAELSQPGESKVKAFSFKNDELYDFINNIGDEREKAAEAAKKGRGAKDYGKYAFMTEDEVGVYNYLYATKGKDAANSFLKYLDPELNAQWASGASANNAELATQDAWDEHLYSALTVAAEPSRTLLSTAATIQDIYKTATGEQIDPNSGLRTVSNMTADVRQAISQSKKERWTAKGGERAGKIAEFTYNTAMSALDSMMNGFMAAGLGGSIVNPKINLKGYQKAANIIGSALMSSEVASQGIRESKLKGYSDLGALTLGMTRGAIEFMSEKIGGDWIIKAVNDNPASFFNALIHAMIPEGIEENMSDIGNETVNLLIDAIFGTDESFIRSTLRELEAQGYTGDELYKQFFRVLGTQELLTFAGGAFSALGGGTRTYIGNSRAINSAALTLNTDRAGIVDLYNELKSNSENENMDVGAINQLAQLYDVNSVDELKNKVAEYENVTDAIQQGMKQYSQQAASNTAAVVEAEEETEIEQLEAEMLENIRAMPQERLQRYVELAREEQKANEAAGTDETADEASRYSDNLRDALAELARRQEEQKSGKAQAEEVAPVAAETEPVTTSQPAQNTAATVESNATEEYNKPERETSSQRADTVNDNSNQGEKYYDPFTPYPELRQKGQSDAESLVSSGEITANIKTEGKSDSDLRKELKYQQRRVEYFLDEKLAYNLLRDARADYTEQLALHLANINALEIELERRQTDGSNQGNAGDYTGITGRERKLGEESNDENQERSGEMGEVTRARRAAETTEESGDRGLQEAREADTASERTGGRGNAGDQTVQRSVSKKRTGRAGRQVAALYKHFNVDKFMDNPFKNMKKMQSAATFAGNALRSVFGSRDNSSKFVNAWLNNPVNRLSVAVVLSQVRNADKLSSFQAKLSQQVFAANTIIQKFLEGNFTAQDIADIGGFSLEEAQNIVDNAEQNIVKWMANERILKANGEVNNFEFRQQSMSKDRASGKNNTVANIANGENPGTAQTFETTKKYEPKSGDTEYTADNEYGNTVYRRGDTFYVVNKNGYIISEAYDAEDVQNALRYARMVAQKHSPSYDVASVRLFDRDVYQNTSNGEVLSTKAIFRMDKMKSVYGSLASKIMKVAYTNAEEGVRRGTSAWFKLDLSVKETNDARTDVRTLSKATGIIQHLIEESMVVRPDGTRGMKMDNGKYYVFFGMTSSGAKKGECIMVDSEYYDELRTASLGGKTEKEVTRFNPAKYLTASCSIFTPSNADTGIQIAPDYEEKKLDGVQVAVIGDAYTTRFNTLRQFMFVDRTKNADGSVNLESVDYDTLVKAFSITMVRELMEQGKSRAEAEKRAAEVVPNQVKEIMAKNDVGSIINMVTDLMFQATDGTGFVDLPEGSPYQGQSIQFRSLGGFKGQLIGFKFSDYLHAVVPFNEHAEYLYPGENGETAGGLRYQNKDVGVEILDRWGTWIPIKNLRAILFDSTVKFAGQYASTDDFYRTTGKADLRSIPRENVYGSKVSDGVLEGMETRGLAQALRSQRYFTEDEIKRVVSPTLIETVDKIAADEYLSAKLVGVDLNGPPPAKADGKLHALYYQHSRGVNYFEDFDGKRWLYDKLGKLYENYAQGNVPLQEGQVAHGFINPDVIGLIHAMTAITRIYDEKGNIISEGDTEGGGYGLNGYTGLKPGEIFNAEFTNKDTNGNPDNSTAIVRYPTMKAIDVQIRNNIGRDDPVYKEMVERFGLDKGNVYTAINDTLSMFLDNDYDGDSVLAIQGAAAEFYKLLRSRDYVNEDGTPMKKNVLYASTSGIKSKEVESTDFGPVEFSHAKAEKEDLIASAIFSAVEKYLEINDMTSSTHKGPRPVGIYANMVDRLAAIPDSALEKTIKNHPDKYSGMNAKELRYLMEAQFGVACVLSIDYAKTGKEFNEFFTLVDNLNATLYDIAEENGIIPKRAVDENGNKSTKGDLFIPSWWEYGSNSRKQEMVAKHPENVTKNSQSAREAVINFLKLPEKDAKTGKRNWYSKFAKMYGKGRRTNATWEGAMTADISDYAGLSDGFFRTLDSLVNEINSSNNPEYIKLQKLYQKRDVGVKDMTIRNYLLYQGIQKSLGLTNEQFTDLMLAMLTRNAKVGGTGHNIGTISNFDQHEVDKSNTGLSSAKIFSRNIAAANNFSYASQLLSKIYDSTQDIETALIKAREEIANKLNETAASVDPADAAKITRIADVQKYLESGTRRFKTDFNNLFKANKAISPISAREMSLDTLAEYRDMYQSMLDQISSLTDTLGILKMAGSKFSVGAAEYISDIYGDTVKEIRDIMRDIDTLENTLDSLYTTMSKQLAKTEEAAEATAGVFTEATTGLEGLTEEQILDKIRGAINGSNRETDNQSGRQGIYDQSAGRDRSGREEIRSNNSGEQENSGRESREAEQVTINTSGESTVQSGTKLSGKYTLAENKDHYKLTASVDPNTGETSIISEDPDGKELGKYVIANNGQIVPTKSMTAIQRATQAILKRFNIHIIYTTDVLRKVAGENLGKELSGATVKAKDAKTGQRIIFANIGDSERRISVRHEAAHGLIESIDESPAVRLTKLEAFIKSIPLTTNGLISEQEVNETLKHMPDTYQKNKLDLYDEFMANLLSGDDFYGFNPTMSEKFMRVGMNEYKNTGIFPILSDLMLWSAPSTTKADKNALIDFFTDPYKSTDEVYAREVTAGETTETSSSAEETTNQPVAEETTTTNTTPEEEVPLPFGSHRKNIAKNVVKVNRTFEKMISQLGKNKDRQSKQITQTLAKFSGTLKNFLAGKASASELYAAYGNLKGTLYNDETLDPYFNDLINEEQFNNRDAYDEAVEHTIAKFAAHVSQVNEAEKNSSDFTQQGVKRKTEGRVAKAKNFFGSWQLNAPAFFRRLTGYIKSTVGYKFAAGIENANKNMQRHYWEAYKRLEQVAKMDGYKDFADGKNKLTIGGQKISTVEALNLLRMLNTVEYTQKHLKNVKGFTLEDGSRVRIKGEDAQYLLEDYFENRATAVEKAYYKAVSDVFDYFTPEVQRVGMKLNGYIDIMPGDKYSPISWGKGNFEENFNPEEGQLKTDPRYMKSRIEEAGGYLYAAKMDDVMESYIRRMSDYLAFAEMREQLRLMNKNADLRQTKTLGQITGEAMGEDYARFINNYIRDFIHYTDKSDSFWYKARMAMQRGTLIGNPSVMMKQSASYLNAASVIDMKYLMQALTPNEFGRDYAKNKSGLLEYRRITGEFDPTYADMFGQKAIKNPLVRFFKKGISIVDYKTVKRLYVAACLQVRAENPNLDTNSKEFETLVENLFSDAAIQTQPQFDPSLRPENARTKNEGVRMLSMFRTQQSQNFNKLVTAIGEYKADPNADTRAVKAATIKGLVGSGLALALFTSLSDFLLHRRKKYRDEDGEITAKNVAERVLVNSVEAMAGTAWFGDDLAKYIIDRTGIVDTQEFYGLSMGPASTMYDAAESLGEFIDAIGEGKGYVNAGKKFAGYALQAWGIPANNLYNYLNAVTMTAFDVMGKNPDQYDDWTKWLDTQLRAQSQLVKAAEAGNENKVNRMWEKLGKQYAEPKTELNKQLKKDYQRGKVSDSTAENLLVVYGGLEDEDAAKKRVAKWNFDEDHPEYSDLSEGYVQKWNDIIKPAGISLDTYYKAVQKFKELDKDKTNGKDRSEMLAYINTLGLTKDQRDKLWSCFGTTVYTPYDSTNGVYGKYETYAKPVSITPETFAAFYDKANSFESDKDANGKSISGSKQAKVVAYINSLSLTREQKDALFLSMGYTKTTKAWKNRPWR